MRISDFGFRASGVGFRVSSFGFRVSSFESRVSGVGSRVSVSKVLVSCPEAGTGGPFVFQDFRFQDFGFRVSGFQASKTRVLGFGVSYFGSRVSECTVLVVCRKARGVRRGSGLFLLRPRLRGNPKPETRNPKPETRNPRPEIQTPKAGT